MTDVPPQQPPPPPPNGAPSQRDMMMVNAIAKAVSAGVQHALVAALTSQIPVEVGADETTGESTYQHIVPLQLFYDCCAELIENNRNARIANGIPYDDDIDEEEEESPVRRKKKKRRS